MINKHVQRVCRLVILNTHSLGAIVWQNSRDLPRQQEKQPAPSTLPVPYQYGRFVSRSSPHEALFA
ncbi:hypothetical protein AGR7B_Cc50122 [Agrobacterium deltaense RV3]|nr:hypothetical protein AGR7B_Cc50122 [Agrobacterium deltaense RV3]